MATTTRPSSPPEAFAPAPPEIAARAQELIRRPYRKVIGGDEREGFLIEVPDLPGCTTGGATLAEAVANLPEAMAAWVESALLEGDPVPDPTPEPAYSGRVLLRLPKSVHRQLAVQAELEGVSLNQLVLTYVSQGLGAARRGPAAA